jgi:hypothetical protein
MKETVYLSMTAADSDGVCQSQTPGAAGSLTLNGALVSSSVATLDIPRRISIVSAGSDAARIFLVTGTDRHGKSLIEMITGVTTASVSSQNDFATVTDVSVDNATAGAIQVGTNGLASTKWIIPDKNQQNFNVGLCVRITGSIVQDYSGTTYKCIVPNTASSTNQPGIGTSWRSYWAIIGKGFGATWVSGSSYVATGSLTFTVEHTFNDLQINNQNIKTFNHEDLQSLTSDDDGNYSAPVSGIRLTLNAFTSGTAIMNFIQGVD